MRRVLTSHETQPIDIGPICPALINSTDPYPCPQIAAPGYLQSIIDPTFGSKVTRISGDPGTPMVNADGTTIGTWANMTRHRYSTMPVWSSDGKYIWLYFGNGLLLDGETYKPIRFTTSSQVGNSPLWHPIIPDIMIVNKNNQIVFYNLRTGQTTVKVSVSGYEGFFFNTRTAPSNDGRLVAVNARRLIDSKIVGLLFDLETGQKVFPDYDFVANGFVDEGTPGTNAYQISPTASGMYVHIDGWIPTGVNNNSLFYDLNGNLVSEVVHNNIECPGHADLTFDTLGRDIYTGVSKDRTQGYGQVAFVVADGLPVQIISPLAATHTSGRNTAFKGWVFGSNTGDNGTVWRMKLEPPFNNNARVERIAHVHDALSTHCGYYCEPQAVPSPNGSKVIWAGDWDGTLTGVHSFVADVSDICPIQ